MEYIIKQGDNLFCSYTGKPANALIKLIDQDGTQTQYLSREALANADKLLRALEGSQDVVWSIGPSNQPPNALYGTAQSVPPQAPQAPQAIANNMNSGIEDVVIDDDDKENIPGVEPVNTSLVPGKKKSNEDSISPHSKQLLKSFDSACRALCQDPPPDAKGNQSGVPGWAVRNLVNEWKKQFVNKKEMIPIIQKYFESPREVINFMLGLE